MFGALAQLGAHNTGSVGVRGSNPLCSTTKETSFVYQDKRGFFCIIELVVFLHYNYFRKASELRGIQWTN